MGSLFKFLICLTVSFAITACSNNSSPPGAVTSQQEDGTSSGGGSFGDESSTVLLNWSKKVTADIIRRANPAIFKNLPMGWTQSRFANLIENVRPEPKTVVYRHGRELMFDYRRPKGAEPYLVATSLFFRAHASVPVNALWAKNREPYVREIRTKLLHEAAHVLGIGNSEKSDIKARGFAFLLTLAIARNNIICKANDVPENFPGRIDEAFITRKYEGKSKITLDENAKELIKQENQYPYYWIVNRPTAIGLQSWKSPKLESGQPSDMKDRLLKGIPGYSSLFIYLIQTLADPNRLQTSYEVKREFLLFMDGIESEHRMAQQYYRDYKIDESTLSFIGEQELYAVGSDGARDTQSTPCKIGETIIVPKQKRGEMKGQLKYVDTCQLGKPFVDDLRSAPVSGTLELDCVESLIEIGNLTEFMDSQPFTTPALIEWEKTRTQFD